MFVPVSHVNNVLMWFASHYTQVPSASLLLHPNTGYEYEDHSVWAMWAGGAQQLNMSIFEQNTKTNEFDEKPGSPSNPTCVGDGGRCY